jgi:ribonuclease J
MADPVSVTFLGGLGEIGRNCACIEVGGRIMLLDCGLMFPDMDMLGIDLVLPDFTYLRDNADRIEGCIATHGHEDHVGGLPYLLREIDVDEVIATRLTLGLVKSKLDEHGLLRAAELREADPDADPIQLGPFEVEFVRMAHSIPDCVAIVLTTAAGSILHTGDYKIDHTPVDGLRTDVGKLAMLGNRGIDLLLGDSTNAERPGVTQSERTVGEAFRQIMPLRTGRILVTSFASNIHRVQQAVDVAAMTNRKVAIVGRSLRKNVNISRNLGYLEVPDDMILKPAELGEFPRDQQMILCTGSQGEPMSALTRIAYRDHQSIEIERGDTVILSAKPVPGNELRVHDAINRLTRLGAEVLHQEIAPVHVSGHGCAEELRTILSLVRPKAVMPVHGEFRMLDTHARLARDAGVPADSIVLAENGSVVELSPRGVKIVGEVESGVTFVDGLSVGDVRDVALRDRRHLSEHGVLIVVATLTSMNGQAIATPELIGRGMSDEPELLAEAKEEAARVLQECLANDVTEVKLLQEHLHDAIGQLIYDRTERRPMILPVVIEV